MRAASLDRRVRREAKGLVRDARTVLALGTAPDDQTTALRDATEAVEAALADHDLGRVRRGLKALDDLVDDLLVHARKSTARDYIESIGGAVLLALVLRACVVEAFKIPSSSMYPTLEIGDHIFVNKFLYGVRVPFTDHKLLELRGPHRGEVIVFRQPCERPAKDYIKRVVALAGDTVEVRCHVVYVNDVPRATSLLDDDCRYEDYDELNRRWFTRLCSRYRETAGDLSYDLFHDPDRPERDRVLASGGQVRADDRDFPRLDGARIAPACSTNPDGEPLVAKNQRRGSLAERTPGGTFGPCDRQLHYVVPPGHVFVMGDNRANSNDSRMWGSVPIENIRGKALFIWLSYSHWDWTDWSGLRPDRIGRFVH